MCMYVHYIHNYSHKLRNIQKARQQNMYIHTCIKYVQKTYANEIERLNHILKTLTSHKYYSRTQYFLSAIRFALSHTVNKHVYTISAYIQSVETYILYKLYIQYVHTYNNQKET